MNQQRDLTEFLIATAGETLAPYLAAHHLATGVPVPALCAAAIADADLWALALLAAGLPAVLDAAAAEAARGPRHAVRAMP